MLTSYYICFTILIAMNVVGFELNVVFSIVTSVSGLMRNIFLSDKDDCLLMMCTIAMMSICTIIFCCCFDVL